MSEPNDKTKIKWLEDEIARLRQMTTAAVIRPGMDLSHLSSADLVRLQKELHAEERCR
jgi:hypothetical protein